MADGIEESMGLHLAHTYETYSERFQNHLGWIWELDSILGGDQS